MTKVDKRVKSLAIRNRLLEKRIDQLESEINGLKSINNMREYDERLIIEAIKDSFNELCNANINSYNRISNIMDLISMR